ncbi:hypothetical protein Nepgr_029514 [Nepenthes gracilis]|uniref:Uncharacterized protein n=1 Tax=Nepenthes gracilis TaxID=150966 RepID=A0AAD3TEA1_NEPGR|nr:hypothetical protein Nepgr_029514 [Nepenthes gracilis]
MLPPQSFRRSPGRDPRTDSHKRGRSLESGLSFKEKDDLALFNEMQSKEPDNFLLQSTDDFEDIFTAKLKPFSDFKLGITIPVRGEPSDLLNADGNKNDYDWLLTPPDTPLFPSLDDEPAPANLVHSGRPRSRPISISRSSTMEKRSSRGSASPQRSSPSPRSGNSKASQRRPSSATRSSPTPSLRRTSPSQRPSPPPIKSPMPVMRSATPTPRQTSEVSTGSVISSRMRGTSPISTSRGNSASPKIRAWQSNIPGFSLEAPPNLRTSLADRPISYVRGSSPASRNSRDSASKFGRQSMSPTASRSISSSHSHERDRLSSHSKGSLASSGDDDADSLQFIPASGLEQPLPTRMVRGVPSNCSSAFSKKLTKRNSPNAAPKRSFDYAMRQMDHKSPQNMFRPLLSSVPSSTFHSSSHHTMISRNSSVTTSSNDSSDQATSGAPDTEGSGQTQDDMANECGRRPFPDTQDVVFPCDKLDVPCDKFEANHGGTEKLSHLDATVARNATSESFYVQGDSFEVGPENPLLCTRCGCRYFSNELKECDVNICPDCKQKEELSTGPIPVTRVDAAPNLSDPLTMIFEDHGPIEAAEPCMVVQQLPETVEMGELRSGLLTASHEEDANANQSSNGSSKQSCFLDDSPPSSAEAKGMQLLSDQQEVKQPPTACNPSDTNCQGQELYKCDDSLQSKVDVAEGVGISVLVLKRSGSRKGHIMHSRNMTASAISYDDSFCARDSTISMRSSVGHGSASTSSSMDLTSVRHVDIPMQRQLSSTRSELSSKPQSNVSSFSGTSTHAYQALGISASPCKENVEVSAGNVGRTLHETQGQHPESFLASENAELPDPVTFLSRRTLSGDDDFNCSCFKAKDTDSLELSSHNVSTQSEGNSLASLAVDEDHVLHGINEVFPASVESEVNMEEPAVIHESSFVVEDSAPDNGADQKEIMEIIHRNSLGAMSEIEIDNCCLSSPASPIEIALKDDFQEPSFVSGQEKDVRSSVTLSNDSDHRQGIVVFTEDSTVMVHNGGRMTRSLTLEEATDTILFCSSIIHTLAYEAAGIAMEKEKENLAPLEGYRQAAITPGNARWDPRGRTPSRRKIKSQKPKQLWVETETKSPPFKTEPNNNPDEPTTRIVGLQNKVDNMKPPPKLESKCNCRIM